MPPGGRHQPQWAVLGHSGQAGGSAGVGGEQETSILHLAWQAHTDNAALAFSPDGRLLASGSWDGSLKLWDVESGALRWSSWHPKGILSLAFAPDGSLLASGGVIPPSGSGTRSWAPTAELAAIPVRSSRWPGARMGTCLPVASFDGQIRLWEIGQSRPAACLRTLAGHTTGCLRLAFAPDGRTLASASLDWTVKLWDVGQEGI